jgi:WXG100 family type VII secretion target
VTGFRADLASLSDLVARLALFETRADALAAELDARVRRLHGDWTGPAAAAHQAAHREWLDGAARMRAAARELRSAVATAHANYAAAASANTRMWR